MPTEAEIAAAAHTLAPKLFGKEFSDLNEIDRDSCMATAQEILDASSDVASRPMTIDTPAPREEISPEMLAERDRARAGDTLANFVLMRRLWFEMARRQPNPNQWLHDQERAAQNDLAMLRPTFPGTSFPPDTIEHASNMITQMLAGLRVVQRG